MLLSQVESVWKEGTGPRWDNDRRRRKLLEVERTVCLLVCVLLELFRAKQSDRSNF